MVLENTWLFDYLFLYCESWSNSSNRELNHYSLRQFAFGMAEPILITSRNSVQLGYSTRSGDKDASCENEITSVCRLELQLVYHQLQTAPRSYLNVDRVSFFCDMEDSVRSTEESRWGSPVEWLVLMSGMKATAGTGCLTPSTSPRLSHSSTVLGTSGRSIKYDEIK